MLYIDIFSLSPSTYTDELWSCSGAAFPVHTDAQDTFILQVDTGLNLHWSHMVSRAAAYAMQYAASLSPGDLSPFLKCFLPSDSAEYLCCVFKVAGEKIWKVFRMILWCRYVMVQDDVNVCDSDV